MTLPVLQKACHQDHRNLIWWASRDPAARRVRPCFHCARIMVEVADVPTEGDHDLSLDVCDRCQLIWFDPGELDLLPKQPPSGKAPELSPRARELLAVYEIERIQRDAEREGTGTAVAGPEEAWKWIPGLLSLPVEYDAPVKSRASVVTWSVAATVALVSLLAFTDLQAFVASFGFIPAEAFRLGGLTALTSFFIHGGLWHLAANLYFLVTFGDNVEDFLGRARYLTLIAVATVFGAILHALFDPQSAVPVIGASGGISGILAFYAFAFPRSKVGLTHFWYLAYTDGRWVCLPVWMIFVGWLILQFIGVWQQLVGWSNVSALAHLGGAAAGFLLWIVWREAAESAGEFAS